VGWKSFAIFVQPPGGAALGDPSSLSDCGTEALCNALVPGLYSSDGSSTLDRAIYPPKGELYLKNYRTAAVICEQDIACAFFSGRKHLWRSRTSPLAASTRDTILSLFPDREIVVLVLHSVVNLWGYAVYQSGTLIRCAAGTADDGIICDMGIPLPEEQPALEHRALAAIDETGDGEELVFDVARRVFGERLDHVALKSFALTRYVRNPTQMRSWIRRVFGS
jgi:hypothetical protein